MGLSGAVQAMDESKAKDAVPVAVMPGAPSHAHWLVLPTSPFLTPGYQPDGRLSATQLVDAWRRAGMTPQQALELVPALAPLTPVVMGVRDGRLEARLVNEAQQACERLAARYPQAHARLARGIHIPTEASLDRQWRPVVEAFQTLRADPSRAPLKEAVTMAQARQALVEATSAAGLRALRIPLGNWQSPAHLQNLAQGLVLANDDLQQATGWQGRVLGLGGRMELTLGRPALADDRGAEGVAFGARDGRVQVISQWNTMGHEWLHGLDYVLGRQLIGARGTLSDAQDAGANAWSQAQSDINTASPQWQALRTQAANAGGAAGAYWLDRSEAMAYAFSAWMTRTAAPTALREDTLGRSEREQPFRSPSREETRAQAPIFRDLFQALAGMDLTAAAPTTTPHLGSLLEQRRTTQGTVFQADIALGRTLR